MKQIQLSHFGSSRRPRQIPPLQSLVMAPKKAAPLGLTYLPPAAAATSPAVAGAHAATTLAVAENPFGTLEEALTERIMNFVQASPRTLQRQRYWGTHGPGMVTPLPLVCREWHRLCALALTDRG